MGQGPDNGVELTPLAGETRKQLAQEEEKYPSPRLPLNDASEAASTTPQYQTPPAPTATDYRWDRTVLRCEVKANQVIRVLAIGCILIFGYVTQGAAKRMWHQRTARFSVSLPPMNQLLDTRGRKVVGSLDPLMQFGVVGFNRCGTNSISNWISKAGEHVVIDTHTHNPLRNGQSFVFGTITYNHLQEHVEKLNEKHRSTRDHSKEKVEISSGIMLPSLMNTRKGPLSLSNDFNSTKLIVSIRHPVFWFQSLYNQRLHQRSRRKDTSRELRGKEPHLKKKSRKSMPSPWDAVGCKKTYTQGLCTDRAEFHRYLARFAKTAMDTAEELETLRHYGCGDTVPKIKNCALSDEDGVLKPLAPFGGKIFVIELSQIRARKDELRRDLSDYLGLDLPDMSPLSNKGYVFDEAIDICDGQYKDIRDVLLMHARRSSRWILDYFLQSPDVLVSSREYFVETLENWGKDPCDSRRKTLELTEEHVDYDW